MKTRLKILRNLQGITQEKLAKEIHCAQQTISKIEKEQHNALSLDVAIRLADYFNVNLDYLLFRSNVKKSFTPENQFPNEDEKATRFLYYYNQLSEEQKKVVLDMLKQFTNNK